VADSYIQEETRWTGFVGRSTPCSADTHQGDMSRTGIGPFALKAHSETGQWASLVGPDAILDGILRAGC